MILIFFGLVLALSSHKIYVFANKTQVYDNETLSEDDMFLVNQGIVAPPDDLIGWALISIRSPPDDPFGESHRCAGTIITPVKVLTAAHCLVTGNGLLSRKSYSIVVGTPGRLCVNKYTKLYKVDRVHIHRKFSMFHYRYDIGLIITRWPIVMVPGVVAIAPVSAKPPGPDAKCYSYGWGRWWPDGPMSNEIMKVQLKLVDKKYCKYPNYKEEVMICAKSSKSNGGDTCQYDGGGPLTCDGEIVGIVSFGFNCVRKEGAVYTNAVNLHKWIVMNHASKKVFNLHLFWCCLVMCLLLK